VTVQAKSFLALASKYFYLSSIILLCYLVMVCYPIRY